VVYKNNPNKNVYPEIEEQEFNFMDSFFSSDLCNNKERCTNEDYNDLLRRGVFSKEDMKILNKKTLNYISNENWKAGRKAINQTGKPYVSKVIPQTISRAFIGSSTILHNIVQI
jgi:hypothetical protein